MCSLNLFNDSRLHAFQVLGSGAKDYVFDDLMDAEIAFVHYHLGLIVCDPKEDCMTEDHFKLILSQSKNNFRQINNPPIVVYNPQKKTVSVKYDFALGLIKKIKIIASCNIWLDFRRPEKSDNISFKTIEPYLYRPSKDQKKGLKQYSRNYPGSFLADVLDCIKWSHTKNPLI